MRWVIEPSGARRRIHDNSRFSMEDSVAVSAASPVRTLIAGAAAQFALFVAITLVTGLGPSGWLTGIAYLAIGCAAIITGLRRYGVTAFGPADLVTLTRAVLIGGGAGPICAT